MQVGELGDGDTLRNQAPKSQIGVNFDPLSVVLWAGTLSLIAGSLLDLTLHLVTTGGGGNSLGAPPCTLTCLMGLSPCSSAARFTPERVRSVVWICQSIRSKRSET